MQEVSMGHFPHGSHLYCLPRQSRPLSSLLWEPLWYFLILKHGIGRQARQPWRRHMLELRFKTLMIAITQFPVLGIVFVQQPIVLQSLWAWVMVAVGTLSEYEHVTQALTVWPCLSFLPLFRFWHFEWPNWQEKKFDISYLFTGLTNTGKKQSQKQRDFPTSCLPLEINFRLHRASWEGPFRKVSWLCPARIFTLTWTKR